jgi:hypothetical protein
VAHRAPVVGKIPDRQQDGLGAETATDVLRKNPTVGMTRCCARATSGQAAAAAEQRHEIASLHCLPQAHIHVMCGFQFWPSNQERASSKMGGKCGNVRCKNPKPLMSQMGQ